MRSKQQNRLAESADEDFGSWDVDKVAAFFQSLNLGADYSSTIEKQSIDGRALQALARHYDFKSIVENLKEHLQVHNYGDRLIIASVLEEFEQHQVKPNQSASALWLQRLRATKAQQSTEDSSITVNPLLQPVVNAGFSRVAIAEEDELDFFDNPALDTHEIESNPNVSRKLPAPRWSIAVQGGDAAGAFDSTQQKFQEYGMILGIAIRTYLSWRKHLVLMAIVLGVTFLYEVSEL
jgi:hypothetical protein